MHRAARRWAYATYSALALPVTHGDHIKDEVRIAAAAAELELRRGAALRPAARSALLLSAAAAVERGDGTASMLLRRSIPELCLVYHSPRPRHS